MLDVLQSLETKDVLRLLETLGSSALPAISRCHTSILGKLQKNQALFDLWGQSQRVIIYIYILYNIIYIYIMLCLYIYIETCNMRFISLNHTAVPRAPDFSRLFGGLAPFSTELRRFPWETSEDGTFSIIRLDYWLIVGGNCQMMDYW